MAPTLGLGMGHSFLGFLLCPWAVGLLDTALGWRMGRKTFLDGHNRCYHKLAPGIAWRMGPMGMVCVINSPAHCRPHHCPLRAGAFLGSLPSTHPRVGGLDPPQEVMSYPSLEMFKQSFAAPGLEYYRAISCIWGRSVSCCGKSTRSLVPQPEFCSQLYHLLPEGLGANLLNSLTLAFLT